MRDDFLSYTRLEWQLASTYLFVISFFYILINERSSIILCAFGLLLTGFLVYLSAAARLRKHQALFEALRYREIKPFGKPNLGILFPFMFIIWILGLLWCYQISLFFEPRLTYMILLAEPWTFYIAYFALTYNDSIKILRNIWRY